MKLLKLVAFVMLAPLLAFGNITSQIDKTGPIPIAAFPQVIPVGYPFQQSSDLLVLDVGSGGTPHDPALVLTLNSDYSVTGGGYNSQTQMQTGSISVVTGGAHNVLVGDSVVIMRGVPINQISSFTHTGSMTIALLEQALDKQATLSQQLNELSNRSLHFENFENINGVLSLSARKNNTIVFDATGNITFQPPGTGGGGGGGGVYNAGAGLLLASNVFSINPVQALTTLTVSNPIGGSITGNAVTATTATTAITATTATTANQIADTVTTTNNTFYPLLVLTPGSGSDSVLKATAFNYNASTGLLTTPAYSGAVTSSNVSLTGGLINGVPVTGLPAPVNSSDAATKGYVDASAAGLIVRSPVAVATTANITLSGEQTIDGVLTSTSRILVKNETATETNGIYVTAAGAWSRASDSNTAGQLKVGYYYFVSSGTTQGASGWTISTAPTNLGTDPVLFSQFSASTSYVAGANLVLTGNVFSLNAAPSGLAIAGSTYNGNTITTGTGTLTLAAGKTLAVNKTLTFTGTDGTTETFPTTSAVIARTDAAQTFTGLETFNGGFTIPTSAGTSGASNSPAVGGKLSFATFTSGTTTTIVLPSASNGNWFYLDLQACDGVATLTYSGASVFRAGDPNVAIPSGVFSPGPGGNHLLLLQFIGSRWVQSDDCFTPINVRSISQANAFTIGEAVYNANGTWTASDNTTTLAAAQVDGVVTVTGNPFTVTTIGYENQITGLAANTQYYLGTAGALTGTVPTLAGGAAWLVPVLHTGVAADGTVQISTPASLAKIAYVDLNANVAQAVTASNDFFFGNAGNVTTTGIKNTGVGGIALASVTTGGGNTGLGYSAANAITTGSQNTAGGHLALSLTTTADANTAFGYQALKSNITGANNSAFGNNALQQNTGDNNTAQGGFALQANTSGAGNAAFGNGALVANTTASAQTAGGFQALADVTTGGNNTAFGYNTGRGITTGTNNTILGANVTGLTAGLSNNIIIANGAGTIKAQNNNTQWTFDTFTIDTLAHERTTKGNLNLRINVKDYGAVGDGSTDDTTAITAAVTAIPANFGILYFPAGSYLFNPTTAGLNTLASKTNLTIYGDGIGNSVILSNTAGQTISLASSCSYVNVYGLTIDGGCTARTSGAHCFYSQAASTSVHDVEIKHSGEFALFIDGTTDVNVSHVRVTTCYADGVHINNCTRVNVDNCSSTGADDDTYALSACTDLTLTGGFGKGRAYGECMSNALGIGGSPNDYIPTYTYNSTTSTPPASATFRMNSATPSSVTLIWINDTDAGGFSLSTVFFGSTILDTGYILQVRAVASRLTNYQRYTVSGTPTHTGAYTIVPVTFLDSAGSIANGTSCNLAPSSTWGRGLYLAGNTDCLIDGLAIDGCKQAGVRGEILSSTRQTRTHLKAMKVRDSTNGHGGGHGIWFVNSTDSSITGCTVEDVAAGDLIHIEDWQNLTVAGNVLTQTRAQFCRGIEAGTDITSPTAWNGLKVAKNTISLTSASNNESIYLAPNSAITMTDVLVEGNDSSQADTGSSIFTDYTASPVKVGNNTSQQGRAITNGGHGTAPTTFNNQ